MYVGGQNTYRYRKVCKLGGWDVCWWAKYLCVQKINKFLLEIESVDSFRYLSLLWVSIVLISYSFSFSKLRLKLIKNERSASRKVVFKKFHLRISKSNTLKSALNRYF